MFLLPASVDRHRVRDALLAALALAAGSVDALAWLALGKVFSAGVATVARHSVEQHTDPTRTTVSSAPHPLTRAFGRTADEARPGSNGR